MAAARNPSQIRAPAHSQAKPRRLYSAPGACFVPFPQAQALFAFNMRRRLVKTTRIFGAATAVAILALASAAVSVSVSTTD